MAREPQFKIDVTSKDKELRHSYPSHEARENMHELSRGAYDQQTQFKIEQEFRKIVTTKQ